jgi:hypothetical protein
VFVLFGNLILNQLFAGWLFLNSEETDESLPRILAGRNKFGPRTATASADTVKHGSLLVAKFILRPVLKP